MQLLRRASAAFALFALGKLLGYVLQISLARLTTPAVYGMYTVALGVSLLITEFASLGYNNSMVRFVPELLASRSYPELRGFLKLADRVTFFSGLALAGLGFGIFLLLPTGFNPLSAALFALSIPFMGWVEYLSQVSRSVGKSTLSILPNSLLRPLANILLLVFFAFVLRNVLPWHPAVPSRLPLSLVALGIVGGNAVALLGFRWVSPKRRQVWRKVKPNYAQRKKWGRVSASMMRMVGFQTVLAQTDVILIGLFISTTAAGLYGVGTKVAVLASFVFLAVNQVFAPNISSTYATGDRARLQQELTKASVLTFVPTLLVAGTLYLGSSRLLDLFGRQFQAAQGVLHILLVGQLVNAAAGPVAYVLSLTGNHKVSTRIYGVTAVLNVVGCYVAAKYGGTMEDVAWVTTASTVFSNVWLHMSVAKRLHVWPSIFSQMKLRVRPRKSDRRARLANRNAAANSGYDGRGSG